MWLMVKLGKIYSKMCVSTISSEMESKATIDTWLETGFLALYKVKDSQDI